MKKGTKIVIGLVITILLIRRKNIPPEFFAVFDKIIEVGR